MPIVIIEASALMAFLCTQESSPLLRSARSSGKATAADRPSVSMPNDQVDAARRRLLAIHGIGPETADAIQAMGGKHTPATHGEVVIDDTLRLITSPCYMLDASISQIADGTDNAVRALLDMVRQDRRAA